MVACSVKSGSTYVADVLSRYLEVEAGNRDVTLYWPAEQNLSREILEPLRDRSFVLQMHLRPHPSNLELCAEYGISIATHWRNLADVIPSFDDHIRIFGERQPVCYIHDRERFLCMPTQARYQFLIRYAIPWYLGFYLAWRRLQVPFGVYERMVADPRAYFREVIARLNVEADEQRLESVLRAPLTNVRFNVGKVGRAAECFTEETKRLLEATILKYEPSADVEVLLWELPWRVPALAPRSPYDGTLIQVPGEDPVFFVSRGVRRWVTHPSWIASRATLQDTPIRMVTPKELRAIPDGGSLT